MAGSSLTTTYYDDDYYAFDVPKAGRATISLTFPSGLGTGTAYYVNVLDQNGTVLYQVPVKAGDWNGAALKSLATYLPAGRFYIGVSGRDSYASWGKTYKLSMTVTATRAEAEPNRSTASANVVPLGATVAGSSLTTTYYDDDYYAFDVPKAGRATISLTFPSGLGTGTAYYVNVLDQNGTVLYQVPVKAGDWNGAALKSLATYLPAGRFYIGVSGRDSYASWGKTYKLSMTVTATRAEAEPNRSTASANVVPLGATVAGSSLTTTYYDDDYYAFDVPKAGRATISLTFPSGLGTGTAYYVNVLDQNGTVLYQVPVKAGDWNGAQLRSQAITLPAGRTYLLVSGRDSYSTWGKTYKLSMALKLTATPTPTISGTTKVGKTLTAKAGTWAPSGVALHYRWKRNGASITGAVKSTYRLTASDAGKKITVTVTGTKTGYKTVAKTSAARSVVK
ncbi:hypothetical protein Q9R19_02115 [Microbacterium sp. ARD32]|uniref:hypothetical protein n=1 Tax=Microbacterium sp. ARD32 TaxID=2962577 RepID=UPI002882574C|nr:hypothetical protein [Microbacterium sp. ARD32]MDT0156412.1 hypothetical protein [Microbacterium sp. ARD32]